MDLKALTLFIPGKSSLCSSSVNKGSYDTCESGRVLDSEGCNTAGQILAQHIVELEQSPSFTELKETKTKQLKQAKINDKIEQCFRAFMTPFLSSNDME